MALDKGSITINPDGSHSSSGLAGRIFEAQVAEPSFPTVGPMYSVGAVVLWKTGTARFAQTLADAIIDELTANAEVTVQIDPLDVGLQTSTAVGTPTGGPPPPNPVTLTRKGTIA